MDLGTVSTDDSVIVYLTENGLYENYKSTMTLMKHMLQSSILGSLMFIIYINNFSSVASVNFLFHFILFIFYLFIHFYYLQAILVFLPQTTI